MRYALALGMALVLAACSRLVAPGAVLGGGGFGGGPYVGGVEILHTSVGLTSLVPSLDSLRVDWRSVGLEDFTGDLVLYVSADRENLYSSSRLELTLEQGSFIVTGLEGSTEYFAGLAISEVSGGTPTPIGPVLSGITRATFYANPSADMAVANGLTPETAYPNIFLAVLTAQLAGGGNVWMAEGTFADVSLPLLAGVDIYGGFAPDFDLTTRDPALHETIFASLAGENTLKLEVAGDLQRVDGLTIEGGQVATNGIDLDQTPAELRGVHVRECSRGLRLRATLITSLTKVKLIDCSFEQNQLEGLSLEGPYSMRIDSCTFAANGQEGLQFGPWVAPGGATANLIVRDSRFLGNGFEGFDIDLVAPTTVAPGGTFDIRIEDCNFEQNVGHGCFVDLDYDETPLWRTRLSIRGSQARANGDSGFAFDIDSVADVVLHRVQSSANGQDGLSVTSELPASFVLVSASAFIANLGHGVHTSLGNVGVALSHCVISGNSEGGLLPESVGATATSCAAHLQPTPYLNTDLRASVALADAPVPFEYAPVEFRRVLGQTPEALTLDMLPASQAGLAVETAADGVLRTLDAATGQQAQVTPMPTNLQPPSMLAIFPTADSVDEDYRPRSESGLVGAGLTTPAGDSVDAGIFGSPYAGAPGVEDLSLTSLFRVTGTVPGWGQAIAPSAPFTVHFWGGAPDPSTFADGVRVVDAAGVVWPVAIELVEGKLIVSAPTGGWALGDTVELHSTLKSKVAGSPLIPVTLSVGVN